MRAAVHGSGAWAAACLNPDSALGQTGFAAAFGALELAELLKLPELLTIAVQGLRIMLAAYRTSLQVLSAQALLLEVAAAAIPQERGAAQDLALLAPAW